MSYQSNTSLLSLTHSCRSRWSDSAKKSSQAYNATDDPHNQQPKNISSAPTNTMMMTMTRHSNSSNESRLRSVAVTLQERWNKLVQERKKVQDMQDRITETSQRCEEAHMQHQALRRQQLEAIIAQSQSELACFAMQDALVTQRRTLENIMEEAQIIKDENEQILDQWNQELQDIHAPHEMQMQEFRNVLHDKRAISQTNQQSIENMKVQIKRLKKNRKELVHDQRALLSNTQALKLENRSSIETIASLGSKVKEALLERSKLRNDLRNAKAKQRNQDDFP